MSPLGPRMSYATAEEQRNSSKEKEEAGPNGVRHDCSDLVIAADMVKQEMASVNTDNLETSELKWMGMGEFNSDDHHVYFGGQEFLKRNGVALIINKSLKSKTWVQSHQQNDLSLFLKANH